MAGTAYTTSDVVVGVSGGPVRVFFISVLNDGVSATSVAIRNGTSASGTIYDQVDGTTSKATTRTYGAKGILFPGGCFVDVDTHTVSVTVSYENGF